MIIYNRSEYIKPEFVFKKTVNESKYDFENTTMNSDHDHKHMVQLTTYLQTTSYGLDSESFSSTLYVYNYCCNYYWKYIQVYV